MQVTLGTDLYAETSKHVFLVIARTKSQAIGQINPVREHIATINPVALLSSLVLFDLTGSNEVL